MKLLIPAENLTEFRIMNFFFFFWDARMRVMLR